MRQMHLAYGAADPDHRGQPERWGLVCKLRGSPRAPVHLRRRFELPEIASGRTLQAR